MSSTVLPGPGLPPDLERIIIEMEALSRPTHIPTLMLTVWRVKDCYGTVATSLISNNGEFSGSNLSRITSFLSGPLPSTKSPASLSAKLRSCSASLTMDVEASSIMSPPAHQIPCSATSPTSSCSVPNGTSTRTLTSALGKNSASREPEQQDDTTSFISAMPIPLFRLRDEICVILVGSPDSEVTHDMLKEVTAAYLDKDVVLQNSEEYPVYDCPLAVTDFLRTNSANNQGSSYTSYSDQANAELFEGTDHF
ncbi:hypothetical protein B0H13DRAFT_2394307 [Mycena leptocephala]|nr:hypothetical protein B0H13DRAFT_2394307 [Mycena leptocephala]